MKAIQLLEPNLLVQRDMPIPEPAAAEVLIKVRTVGICGTDISIYKGISPAPYPVVLGHEFCGDVVKVGTGVENVKPGDYVISEASWGCGTCYFCQQGQPSYCEKPFVYGRTCDGALAEYVKAPARIVHRISAKVQPVEAQGVTAVATTLRALRRSGINVGQSAAILGPGYTGLLLLQLAKQSGAAPVIVTGTNDDRLQAAETLGADITVNIRRDGWLDKILAATDGYGPDVVIEASGRPDALEQALAMVKKGGRIIAFGIAGSPIENFEAGQLYKKDIAIMGSKGGYFEYGNAVKALESHRLKTRELVTHVFQLEDAPEAFRFITNNSRSVVRAVVEVNC